jgi:hypothetical protein
MPKSNVICVDFRPHVRNTNLDSLSAELDVIDAALAAAHVRARELDAELKARDGEAAWSSSLYPPPHRAVAPCAWPPHPELLSGRTGREPA